MLQIIVLVCAIGTAKCDQSTARAYHVYRAPPGFATCGWQSIFVHDEALAPAADEEQHARCAWRPQ